MVRSLQVHEVRVSATLLLWLAISLSAPALAAGLVSSMPVGRIFPDPGGILFPGFGIAAGVNPAAIPLMGRGTAVEAAVTPAIQSGDPNGLFASATNAGSSFGLGLGYDGSLLGGHLTNGVFGGLGYNFDPLSVGVAVRDPDISQSGQASADIGFEYETKSELTLGAVLYNVNHNAQADVGIGTKGGKKYNLEADVLLPPFNNFGSNDFLGTLSASVVPGMIGFHFAVSYDTGAKDWYYTVSGAVFVNDNVDIVLQYATTRQATAAVTVLF